MDKKNASKFLPLVKALSEGKTIQAKGPLGEWLDVVAPLFTDHHEHYRIKPEISLPYRRYLIKDKQGKHIVYVAREDVLSVHLYESSYGFVKWIDEEWIVYEVKAD